MADTKIAPVQGIVPEEQPKQETPKQPDINSERFVQLARKEKAVRQQARKLQEQQRAFEEQRSKAPAPTWQEQIKAKGPIDALIEAGYSRDEIANMLYGQQQDPVNSTIRALQEKIANLESSQNKTLEEVKQSQSQAYQNAMKQVRREVNMLVDGNEAYETIRATSSQDAVVALIEETYSKDGILLSSEEAASQVEDYLMDEALNLAKLKKVQTKLAPPVAETLDKKTQEPQTQTQTLTHSLAGNAGKLSDKERRQRAMLAFQGKLS